MDKEKIIQWISGYGSGSGYGNGSGYGYKLKEHEENDVYYIDGVPTVIRSIKGNYARGYVINQDFNTETCYIARSSDGKLFSHGKNLHDAVNSLSQKIVMSMTEEERISLFCKTFKKR